MALKRTDTPPQPSNNALDLDVVSKSSSGSGGRLSSRLAESSADSSSASASASSRLLGFQRVGRDSQLAQDGDYVASDGVGLTDDDDEGRDLRRIATTRPPSRRSSEGEDEGEGCWTRTKLWLRYWCCLRVACRYIDCKHPRWRGHRPRPRALHVLPYALKQLEQIVC
jgi:hypothetical protein